MLTCRELIDFLGGYLEGELAPEPRAAFDAHLARCRACLDYLIGYREAIRLGKQACDPEAELPPDVPSELVDSILAARRS